MKKMKEKAVKYFAVFLLFMLICTIVSRGIYAYRMPRVTLGSMEERTLVHTIEAYGTVLTKEECPVVTEPGLLVEKVCVVEGQKVAKGDILFEIDETDLQKVIDQTNTNIQIKEAELSQADASENTAVDRANQDLTDVTNATTAEVNQANSEYQSAKDVKNVFPAKEEYINAAAKKDTEYQKLQKAAKKKQATDEEKEAFKAYKKEFEKQAEVAYEQESQALEQVVEEKEQVLNSATENQKEALKQAQRTLEDAKQAAGTEDSMMLESKSQIALLKETRNTLLEIQKSKGQVVSEIEGYVSGISLRAGEKTTDTAALVIGDSNGEKLFQAVLPQEEKAYASMGDKMTISLDNGKKQLNPVEIDAVGELADGSCQITGRIEASDVEIGASGKMTIQKDTGRYACCIPLSALYTENGTSYVFLAEEQDTILGTELIARKRKVKVLDKDEEYAALEDNSVAKEEQLVVSTEKDIKDGARIRLTE